MPSFSNLVKIKLFEISWNFNRVVLQNFLKTSTFRLQLSQLISQSIDEDGLGVTVDDWFILDVSGPGSILKSVERLLVI